MPPRVSVIVTCYNLGRFLPETLASLTAQSYRDFEVCVVDDGSTEPETLAALERVPEGIRVIRTTNCGLSAARNTGLRHSSGEYVCAVDADDVLGPELLGYSVARLDSDPSLTFVSHWLEAFGDERWVWKPERCDFPTLLNLNTVNGSALVRRSALEAVGGWDEAMRDGCEDWDLWITLVERGYRGDIIPEVLFRYRRRADSMSRVKFTGERPSRVFKALVEKHADSYSEHFVWLAAVREAHAVGNRARAELVEERLEFTALPALGRARDDVDGAARRASREAQKVAQTETLNNVTLALGRMAAERDELREQMHHSRQAAEALAHTCAAATHEATALRNSWSWRLTLPLRTLGAWVLLWTGRRQ